MQRSFCLVLAVLLLGGCNSSGDNQSGNENVESTIAENSQGASTAENSSLTVDETIQERVARLKNELKADLKSLKARVDRAATPDEQARIYRESNPVPKFQRQMLELVQNSPEDPATMDAALAGLPYADLERKEIFVAYLLDSCADRLNHKKLLDFLLAEVPSLFVEKSLRKLIQVVPEGQEHAEALLGFKNYFDLRPAFRTTLRQNPGVASRLTNDQVEYINSNRTDEINDELAGYLKQVIDSYGELKYTGTGLGASSKTFGEAAKYELFELQRLNIGDTVPDITGDDLDGIPFKLSDYRGKVVMLDFWGHWCPPCRRMYPRERELVKKLNGLPFALIGVNSDQDLETAKNSVRDDKLPWRNFWDGPQGTGGPIARQWCITDWPTVYLIDAEGVIRYKGVRGYEIEQGIEKLMAEIGHQVDLGAVDLASQ